MNIKDFIFTGSTCAFKYYRAQHAYFQVYNITDKRMYTFPVPLDDVGNGTLHSTEKALTLMRWIRKAIEDGTMIKVHEKESEYCQGDTNSGI